MEGRFWLRGSEGPDGVEDGVVRETWPAILETSRRRVRRYLDAPAPGAGQRRETEHHDRDGEHADRPSGAVAVTVGRRDLERGQRRARRAATRAGHDAGKLTTSSPDLQRVRARVASGFATPLPR